MDTILVFSSIHSSKRFKSISKSFVTSTFLWFKPYIFTYTPYISKVGNTLTKLEPGLPKASNIYFKAISEPSVIAILSTDTPWNVAKELMRGSLSGYVEKNSGVNFLLTDSTTSSGKPPGFSFISKRKIPSRLPPGYLRSNCSINELMYIVPSPTIY